MNRGTQFIRPGWVVAFVLGLGLFVIGPGPIARLDFVGPAFADKGSGSDGGGSDDGGSDDGGSDDGGSDDGGSDDGGSDDGGSDDGGSDDGGSDDGGSDDGGSDDGGSDDGGSDDGGSDDGGSDDGGSDDGGSGESNGKGSDDDSGDDEVPSDEDAVEVAPSAGATAGLSTERDVGGEHVAGEVVLVDDRPELIAMATGLGFVLRDRLALGNLGVTVVRLGTPMGLTVAQARERLESALPEVEIAANDIYRTQAASVALTPDHPARLLGWAATSTACGAGVSVGLIDTDVDESLAVATGIVTRSFIAVGEIAAPPEHGTEVASILLGSPAKAMQGLVPGVRLYSAEVFGVDGDGQPLTTAVRIAEALDWLVGEGVSIANLSLAGGENGLIRLAVEQADARGLVIVAAAGNGGPDAPPAYPAGYDQVIAVTAVDGRMLPLADANRGGYLDFAAPGVGVPVITAHGLERRSGTSFAAPFVTAILAAGIAEQGRAGVESMIASLERNATDLGNPGRDDVYGWGLVRAPAACGEAIEN